MIKHHSKEQGCWGREGRKAEEVGDGSKGVGEGGQFFHFEL